MSPAAERRVDVTTFFSNVQPSKDRPQQHRHMRVAAHRLVCNLEGDRLEVRRQFAVVFLTEPGIPFFVPGWFIPQFELVALPDQNRVLLEPGEIPQVSRDTRMRPLAPMSTSVA